MSGLPKLPPRPSKYYKVWPRDGGKPTMMLPIDKDEAMRSGHYTLDDPAVTEDAELETAEETPAAPETLSVKAAFTRGARARAVDLSMDPHEVLNYFGAVGETKVTVGMVNAVGGRQSDE